MRSANFLDGACATSQGDALPVLRMALNWEGDLGLVFSYIPPPLEAF